MNTQERENTRKKFIYNESNYSLEKTCFGAVLTSTDSLGVTTRNFYDVTKGRLLASVNENTGEGLAYTYDSIGNVYWKNGMSLAKE